MESRYFVWNFSQNALWLRMIFKEKKKQTLQGKAKTLISYIGYLLICSWLCSTLTQSFFLPIFDISRDKLVSDKTEKKITKKIPQPSLHPWMHFWGFLFTPDPYNLQTLWFPHLRIYLRKKNLFWPKPMCWSPRVEKCFWHRTMGEIPEEKVTCFPKMYFLNKQCLDHTYINVLLCICTWNREKHFFI